MIYRALAVAALSAALLVIAPAHARAQTTSARAESVEVSRRADELRADGDHRRAASLYRRAVEIDDTNERAYLGWSDSLLVLGLHQEAVAMLDGARDRLGWTANIGLARGVHLSHLRRWTDALLELERASAALPESFDAAYYLAGARLQRRLWRPAVQAYDVYLARRPPALRAQDHEVRTRRAYALIQAGSPDRARRELEAVLAGDADNRAARALLFVALARSGACKQALGLLPRQSELVRTAPTLRYDRAVCQLRTGNPRAARDTLEAIARTGELPREALLLRGAIYEALDDDSGARASYRKALDANLPAHHHLARVLARAGEHDQVIALLGPRLDSGAAGADELALLSVSLARTGDLERAVIASARLVEVRGTADDWNTRADILLQGKRWSEAEAASQRALAARPDDGGARIALRRALEARADLAFRSGDRGAASAFLTRALEADPDAHDAAFNLALLELAADRAQRALALIGDRIDRLSSPVRGRLVVGRAQASLGRVAAASRSFEVVIADRDAPAAIRAQALSSLAQLVARSSPDRAVALIKRARGLAADDLALAAAMSRSEAEAQLALAERAYRRGAYKQLATNLAALDVSHLPPKQRVRAAILQPFARAQQRGLRAGLTAAGALTDRELTGVAMPASAMRHVIALHLGMAFMRRASDYNLLRRHASALHKRAARDDATRDLLTAFYDSMLGWARERGAGALARTVARTAPPTLRTPAFEHNAIVAAATARKPATLTTAERARLVELAPDLLEAHINLAIDAENRGDHAAVLGQLEAIPANRRSARVRTWLRWKELLHGAP